MTYREPQAADIAFFQEHGWLVVEDAIEPADIADVSNRMAVILEKKHKLAYDWAWEKGKSRGARVQDRAGQPDDGVAGDFRD